MAENIELHSFCTSSVKDSDIEEYHEVSQEFIQENAGPPQTPQYTTKTLNEYDFFTQRDVKVAGKVGTKKKKSKKKEKSSKLMDIISSELASVAVPITENVISKAEFTAEHQRSYLETVPRALKIFQKRPISSDFENGWSHNPVKLTPKFPGAVETTEEQSLHVQYVEPVFFNNLIAEYSTEDKQTVKFLDIEIRDIQCKHHHQFSLEKLLGVKLFECYNEYNSIERSLRDIERDIKVLRETKNSLKEDLLKISPNKKEDIRLDPSLRKYTGMLLELKEKRLKTLQRRKEMIHKMISLWSDIEMVREKFENKDTPYTLIISRKVLDDNEFDREWNEVFNIEFVDLLDKLEYEYVSKYIEYKEVKYTQNIDDSTKKRISKPKLQIDENTVKADVEKIVDNIVIKERMNIVLKQDDHFQFEASKSAKSILKQKYFFEIYVDDIFVCESEHFFKKHDNSLDIEFTESFSVQILPKNTSISIVLNENDREASAYKLDLSEIKKNNVNAEFVPKTLVFNDIIEPNAKHVGSGHNIREIAAEQKVRLKSSNLFKGNLYNTCEINIKVGWNENLNENQSEAIKSSMETGRQIKRLLHGIEKPNTEVLVDLISKVYGRDVSNDENMIKSLKNLCKGDVKTEDTFPLDENSPEYVRLKLLHLRNTGELNIDDKLIPLHASQITTEQLNCLQKSDENEFDVQYFSDKYAEMDPIELQRFIGTKYVHKLNKNLLRNLNEHLLKKTHKDVVRDFKDLSLRNLFTNQSTLATLASVSHSTKQRLLNEALAKQQEVKVTVMRAFSLLDRLDLEDSEEQIAGFKVRPLRPFVRLTYHGVAAQTATAIGCHPTWNQTLKIATKLEPLSSLHINVYDEHKVDISEGTSDDDRSHSKTVHYRYYSKWLGMLTIPMHTVLSMGSLRGTFKLSTPPMLFGYDNPSQNKESPSLIPEVTQLLRKDTSFVSLHITTNLFNLGGLQGYHQPIPNSDNDYLIKHLNAFVTGYTNQFPSRTISLAFIDSTGTNKCVTQFIQPIPLPDYESFPKNPRVRSESALSKSSGKSSSSRSSGRKKEEDKSFHSEERESIYSTVSWKNGESQLTKLVNACVRYVSLIPTYEVTESHCVTLMGLELLKVLYGSPLDHTILLASYFTHLGIKCWVAIGIGLPRGRSSYVLTKYDLTSRRVLLQNDRERSRGFLNRGDGYCWHVYDAVSGERSELRDVGCPMKTVDYVFDCENIWVNVQSCQDCENVSFDFTRSSEWQPVFDKSVFVPQSLAAEVGYSPALSVGRLRTALEERLRDRLQRWRSHTTTVWNRYCSTLLREMLPHWEYWAFNPTEPKPVPSQRLRQLMATYKVFGFPLNMPYASTKAVVSAVKATALHATDDPSVEFAMAVEVYAYPNNVLSVWVFLASITRL